jgi:threonine dehydratase
MTVTFDEPLLQRAEALDSAVHEVWLRREDLGPLRTFKWRGALAQCEQLQREGAAGVVAASTGNFAAAVVWAAAMCGIAAKVVVPESTSSAKLDTLDALGADVVLQGESLMDSAALAEQLADGEGLFYFEDGGSAAQIDGINQIGVELAEAQPDAVIVPVACGALAAGIAGGLRSAGSEAAVIGAQARACSRLAARFHGRPDPPSRPSETIADGLADDRIVDPAYARCVELLSDVVVVEETDIRAAIRAIHSDVGVLVEGAAATPLAALVNCADRIPHGRVVLTISGANIAPELAAEVLAGTD